MVIYSKIVQGILAGGLGGFLIHDIYRPIIKIEKKRIMGPSSDVLEFTVRNIGKTPMVITNISIKETFADNRPQKFLPLSNPNKTVKPRYDEHLCYITRKDDIVHIGVLNDPWIKHREHNIISIDVEIKYWFFFTDNKSIIIRQNSILGC